jgi:hypothetical protein
VQYIQNTINKAEIEKIKNNHKGIDVEGRRRAISEVYVCVDTLFGKSGYP